MQYILKKLAVFKTPVRLTAIHWAIQRCQAAGICPYPKRMYKHLFETFAFFKSVQLFRADYG